MTKSHVWVLIIGAWLLFGYCDLVIGDSEYMFKKEKKLGEILMEKGFIDEGQLNYAIAEQKRTRELLGSILIKNNYVREKELLQAISEQFNIPFISIKYKYIDWELVNKFSPSLILDCRCFPIEGDDHSVTVAITNPLDAWALKKIEEEARDLKLKLALVSDEDMKVAIGRYEEYIRERYF